MFSNSNIKKIYLILILIISQTMAFSQSAELKEAFNNVSRTLKDYKFNSKDVEDYKFTSNGKTSSIKIQLKGGYLIFLITDVFPENYDGFYRAGTKILKAPISNVEFDGFRENVCEIESSEGVELTYKNKKELFRSYQLVWGTDLSIAKLKKELQELIAIAKKENFNGNLGVPSSSSNSSPNKNANNTSKTVGKYVQ